MSKGFTLIEIIIAIGIVAALSVFIIPAFRRYNDEQVLRNTTSTLVQAIRQTQNNSQSRQKCADGNPSSSWGLTLASNAVSSTWTYQIVSECQNPQANNTIYADTTGFPAKEFPAGLSVSQQTNEEPRFYNPDCVLTGSFPLTIRFYNSQNYVTFTNVVDNKVSAFNCPGRPSQSEKLEFYLQSSKTSLVAKITVNRGGSINVD